MATKRIVFVVVGVVVIGQKFSLSFEIDRHNNILCVEFFSRYDCKWWMMFVRNFAFENFDLMNVFFSITFWRLKNGFFFLVSQLNSLIVTDKENELITKTHTNNRWIWSKQKDQKWNEELITFVCIPVYFNSDAVEWRFVAKIMHAMESNLNVNDAKNVIDKACVKSNGRQTIPDANWSNQLFTENWTFRHSVWLAKRAFCVPRCDGLCCIV